MNEEWRKKDHVELCSKCWSCIRCWCCTDTQVYVDVKLYLLLSVSCIRIESISIFMYTRCALIYRFLFIYLCCYYCLMLLLCSLCMSLSFHSSTSLKALSHFRAIHSTFWIFHFVFVCAPVFEMVLLVRRDHPMHLRIVGHSNNWTVSSTTRAFSIHFISFHSIIYKQIYRVCKCVFVCA